jgi:hypothetical protein
MMVAMVANMSPVEIRPQSHFFQCRDPIHGIMNYNKSAKAAAAASEKSVVLLTGRLIVPEVD